VNSKAFRPEDAKQIPIEHPEFVSFL